MESLSSLPTDASAANPAFGDLSALIIDDEAHARKYVRLLLESLGVTTLWEAGSGAEGLALYAEHQPSVVLLDVNMPVMKGDVVLTKLCEIDPHAAVIVMTSESQIGVVKTFQQLGAIGYVLKHVPRETAVKMIGEVLGALVGGDEEA
ncbi:MAG: response regulator [Verrucomicrobia bacterium]|nr:response regulator [Verrucomicrobiota bacterium]